MSVACLGLLVMFSGLGFRIRVRGNFSGVADWLAAAIFILVDYGDND